MNVSIIRFTLGQVLKLEALLMLLPCIIACIYQESSGFAFVLAFVICGITGFILSYKKQ